MTATTATHKTEGEATRAYFLCLAREIARHLKARGEASSPQAVNRLVSFSLSGGNTPARWASAAEEALAGLRGHALGFEFEDEADSASAYEEALENAEYRASLRYGSAKY